MAAGLLLQLKLEEFLGLRDFHLEFDGSPGPRDFHLEFEVLSRAAGFPPGVPGSPGLRDCHLDFDGACGISTWSSRGLPGWGASTSNSKESPGLRDFHVEFDGPPGLRDFHSEFEESPEVARRPP